MCFSDGTSSPVLGAAVLGLYADTFPVGDGEISAITVRPSYTSLLGTTPGKVLLTSKSGEEIQISKALDSQVTGT